MALIKPSVITVIPAIAAQSAVAPSTVCTAPPPPPVGEQPPPEGSGEGEGDHIYLHVPKNPADESFGSDMISSEAPAPPGYTCSLGTALIPDPFFPGGQIPVYGMHCYWDYPP